MQPHREGFDMFGNSTKTASSFLVLISGLLFSLVLANIVSAQTSVSSAQTNTSLGTGALQSNTMGTVNTANGAFALGSNTSGSFNTAIGSGALRDDTTGSFNTASGVSALISNSTGSNNTAIGASANVSVENLNNATAIGSGAVVDASNKVRLGNIAVTVIEGPVAFTSVSDKTKKENFKPVDGEQVLNKIRGFELTSWNFIGHDPKAFRHYGPMAQDFFAAFGQDGIGQVGSETTINSGDMAGILMIAVQALEKRTAELKERDAQIALLARQVEELQAKQAYFETAAARLDKLPENQRVQRRVEQLSELQ